MPCHDDFLGLGHAGGHDGHIAQARSLHLRHQRQQLMVAHGSHQSIWRRGLELADEGREIGALVVHALEQLDLPVELGQCHRDVLGHRRAEGG